jgi:inosine/xanthosine triphosphatase
LKTVVIASNNPVKIQATLNGFQRMFQGENFCIQALSVPSGVGDQPHSNSEALHGAYNRAIGAADQAQEADFWVGIEGGVEEMDDELTAFAWVVIKNASLLGKSRTVTFFLPPQIARLVRDGNELGEADDIVFGRSNSKQENGAIGLLTGDVVDRKAAYEQAVILALIPFKNQALYLQME